MPLDFFRYPCDKPNGNCKKQGVVCKQTVTEKRFGISDAKSDAKEPAFVSFENEEDWDLTVENPQSKEVTFKAIDFCVDFYREEQNEIGQLMQKKRCEGFLYYDDQLIFFEIKNRQNGDWLSKAVAQFIEPIPEFQKAHPELPYKIQKPIIVNRKHGRNNQSESINKKKMHEVFGFDFQVKNTITIP